MIKDMNNKGIKKDFTDVDYNIRREQITTLWKEKAEISGTLVLKESLLSIRNIHLGR